MIIGNFYNCYKNRNWNVILVHESMFIWICHFKCLNYIYLFILCLCTCMCMPCPRDQIQVCRLCGKYLYPWNKLTTPEHCNFDQQPFLQDSFLICIFIFHLSNKVFLIGISFMKPWLFTCPMKGKTSVSPLRGLTTKCLHALLLWNLKLSSYYCSFV